MKIRDFLFAAAICTAGLAGCSKDKDNEVVNPVIEDEGVPTTISLSISQPKTYAVDNNATPAELAFNTVDILIYKGTNLVKHVKLKGTDFEETTTGENKYKIKEKIETTTGIKDIYVGVNLPAAIRSAITANEVKGSLSTINRTTIATLTDTSTGFAMFSTAGIERTLVEEDDATYSTVNTLEVPVERLVAKVTVQSDENLNYNVAGGTLSDIQFGIRNSNKLIYALQQKDGSGTVIDPNYEPSQYDADDFEHLYSGYTAINDYDTPVLNLSHKYAPENTSSSHLTRETTYASIRAKFRPEEFADENGELYTNQNPGAVTFWLVKYNNGDTKYFENEADADKFLTTVSGTKTKYEDGYTYYNMFLNPKGKYNTIRNTYYKTTINSITGLGNSTGEEGGNTTDPVESPTTIDFIIDIVEWQLIENGYDLSI